MAKPGPKKRTVRVDSPLIKSLRAAIDDGNFEEISRSVDRLEAHISDVSTAKRELRRALAYMMIFSLRSCVCVQDLADLCEVTYAAMQRYLRANGHEGTGHVPLELARKAVEHYRNK